MRDILCNENYLNETIKFKEEQIDNKEEKILSIQKDIRDGIQRSSKKNEEIIYDTKVRTFQLLYELLRAKYSLGLECTELEDEYLKGIMIVCDIGCESIGYVNFLQFFCIGILLEVADEKMELLVQTADKSKLDDVLFDFLVNSYGLMRNMKSLAFQKENPYMELIEIIDVAVYDKVKAARLLRVYVEEKWLIGHTDFGWKEAHTKAGYVGLWSFDAAAVAKILSLDDGELQSNNHYPYELKHYKGSKTFIANLPKMNRERTIEDVEGIFTRKELEKIFPMRFQNLINQLIKDYYNLKNDKMWQKYGLGSVWFTIEEFEKERSEKQLLGTILVNKMVDIGFVLQLDYKENIEMYIDGMGDFWNGKEVKLVRFELGNDQNYYARILKESHLNMLYEVSIIEVTA